MDCLVGGDTLTIKEGTYTEATWSRFLNTVSGSAGAPTTIQGAPGETVTLRPANCGGLGAIFSGKFKGSRWLVFQNLILDGINCTGTGFTLGGYDTSEAAHHIIVQDVIIVNTS
jgi:hypothetical protein